MSKDGMERFDAVAASHVGGDKVPGLVALMAHGDDVHVLALGTLAAGGQTRGTGLAVSDRIHDEADHGDCHAGSGPRGPARVGRTGFGELPLLAQPGERWLYNTGAHVLSVLCARAAGMSYDDVLRTRVLEPLGMRDTGFYSTDVERLATAYRPTADGIVVWDPPDGQWSRPPAFHDGAAGLVPTVDDLLAFARMLLRGGDPVLTANQVRELSRDHLTAEQREFGTAFLGGRGWGLGTSVVLEGPWAGAFGWDGGLGTSFLVHPACDLVVIVLTQRMFETAQAPAVHTDLQAAGLAAVE